MPVAKSHRSDAERAAEHCLMVSFQCVATRRAIRPAGGGASETTAEDGSKRFNKAWGHKVDFFAADVVGKRRDGSHVYAQATAGQTEAVRTRRRKLEAIPWHESDTVLVLQLVEQQNPVHRSRKLFYFRIHEYHQWTRSWEVRDQAIPVPRDWFKALKADAFAPLMPMESEPAF